MFHNFKNYCTTQGADVLENETIPEVFLSRFMTKEIFGSDSLFFYLQFEQDTDH